MRYYSLLNELFEKAKQQFGPKSFSYTDLINLASEKNINSSALYIVLLSDTRFVVIDAENISLKIYSNDSIQNRVSKVLENIDVNENKISNDVNRDLKKEIDEDIEETEGNETSNAADNY
ncbi:MAG: hypothetical protein LBF02_02420 [Mycoplasmataceae bacterium]|jgi:hypothetical protein|nr:hypothetical protein [Mycoplasmataceae bacterium]